MSHRRNQAPALLGNLLAASLPNEAPPFAAPVGPATPVRGPGRPDRYKLASGSIVPSVTTIAGRFKDATALLNWANREGFKTGAQLAWEHRDGFADASALAEWADEQARVQRGADEKRDAAGDEGHIVHQWIDDTTHGRELTAFPYSDAEGLARARKAFDAFQAWAAEVDLRVWATEIPLVSESLRCGGTLDSIALVQGVLCLVDWKSGGGCYPEHVIQQAAYRLLLRELAASGKLRELLGFDDVPEGAVLLRLDKETGEAHATILPPEALDLGERAFLLERELYNVAADVAKLVKRPKPKGKAA